MTKKDRQIAHLYRKWIREEAAASAAWRPYCIARDRAEEAAKKWMRAKDGRSRNEHPSLYVGKLK